MSQTSASFSFAVSLRFCRLRAGSTDAGAEFSSCAEGPEREMAGYSSGIWARIMGWAPQARWRRAVVGRERHVTRVTPRTHAIHGYIHGPSNPWELIRRRSTNHRSLRPWTDIRIGPIHTGPQRLTSVIFSKRTANDLR
ncbi:hypothetical protein C8R46DRAFT_1032884 [Mycena filopes]|nr:hypothetical protein C8R46DRAFT_1032884 [Mycena filopes]